MKNKELIVSIFILSLLVAGLIFIFGKSVPADQVMAVPAGEEAPLESVPGDISFYDTVYSFPGKEFDLGQSAVSAGVVPHHLLAGDLIADFYRHLSGREYDTVILLGPNHFHAGESRIISAAEDWQTPFGKLEIDQDLLTALRGQTTAIGLDREVLAVEHSINSQTAFIKKTFPKARFVPLVLSPDITAEEAEALAEAIMAASGNKRLFLIASVDFSHYQDSQTASSHDQASIMALESGEPAAAYDIDIDSPPAIATVLEYSRLTGSEFELLDNSNSAVLSGRPDIESTTSYVTGYFVK